MTTHRRHFDGDGGGSAGRRHGDGRGRDEQLLEHDEGVVAALVAALLCARTVSLRPAYR